MKQKQTLLKVLLLTPVLVGLLSFATPANADTAIPAWARIIGYLGEGLGHLIGTILGLITFAITNIAFPFCYLMIDSLIENAGMFLSGKEYEGGVNPAEITQQIWSFSLGIANGIFLLALIIVSVAIILRIDTKIYNIKKILGGLITAIILSNISLLIVKTALAIGDQLMIAATSLLGSTPGAPSDLLLGIYKSVSSDVNIITSSVPAKMVFIIASLLLLGIMLKLVFVLFQRMIWIFFLLISAPVAFALSILPTTQEYNKKWWEALLKWVLVLPLIMLALTIAKKVIDSAGGVGPLLSWTPPDSASKDTLDPRLLITIAGLVIMYYAGQVDKLIKLGAVSVSGAYQGISKGISDTIGGKNIPGKIGSAAGRAGYRVAMGTKGGRKLEGKRLSQKGLWGRIVNPKGEKGRVDTERVRKIRESQVDALLDRTIANKAKLAPLEEAKKQGNYYDKKQYKRLNDSIKDDLGAVNYFTGKAVRETPSDDSADILANKLDTDYKKMQDPQKESPSKGGMTAMLYNLRAISRSTRLPREERDKARDWLRDHQKDVERIGLDYEKYKPVGTGTKAEESVVDKPAYEGRSIPERAYDIEYTRAKQGLDLIKQKVKIPESTIEKFADDKIVLKDATQDKTSLDSLENNDLDSLQNDIKFSNDVNISDLSLMQKLHEMLDKNASNNEIVAELEHRDINDPGKQKLLITLAGEGLFEDAIEGRIEIIKAKGSQSLGAFLNRIKPELEKVATLRKKSQHIKHLMEEQFIDKQPAYETTITTVIKEKIAEGDTRSEQTIKTEINRNADNYSNTLNNSIKKQVNISPDTLLSDLQGVSLTTKEEIATFFEDNNVDNRKIDKITISEAQEKLRLIKSVTK